MFGLNFLAFARQKLMEVFRSRVSGVFLPSVVSLTLCSCVANDAISARAPYPAISGVTHAIVSVNNVQLHVAEAGKGPLVILLHGFPELWYSWRRQLPAIAQAGFKVIAPDMRGFGDSTIPDDPSAYDVFDFCGDITGLMDQYDAETAIVVGHDWGSAAAFYCAQIAPERFAGLVTVSIPYGGPLSDRPPLERMRETFGEDFFYMLYFQEDAATRELNSRTREVFSKFFASPDAEREPPVITERLASAGGLLERIGTPKAGPTWITQAEINYFVEKFENTGFEGGLNYYRNMDRNWRMLREAGPRKMTRPALFISGTQESAIAGLSEQDLRDSMSTVTPNIKVRLVKGAGHWIQDEDTEAFNSILVEFLRSCDFSPNL